MQEKEGGKQEFQEEEDISYDWLFIITTDQQIGQKFFFSFIGRKVEKWKLRMLGSNLDDFLLLLVNNNHSKLKIYTFETVYTGRGSENFSDG